MTSCPFFRSFDRGHCRSPIDDLIENHSIPITAYYLFKNIGSDTSVCGSKLYFGLVICVISFNLRTLIPQFNKVIVEIYVFEVFGKQARRWRTEETKRAASAARTSEKKMQQGVIKSLIFTPQLHRSKGSVCRHVAPWETFLSTQ